MTDMDVIILAIESSCDDTSAAILKNGKILANCVATQDLHKAYGGVVPEVASRAHQISIVPVVSKAFELAKIDRSEVTSIAVTRGPGLLGSLLVGLSFAKGMALSLDIPLIGVNHMEAHVLAHFIEDPKPQLPFLCLTVSGGHTQLVVVSDPLDMEVIGTTIDDAAGEAFDKTGKLLGLEYPAGPLIDKLAQKGEACFPFPEPKVGALDFSFSGLKTSILYFLKRELKKNPDFITENLNDICASVQTRIVSYLMNKLKKASTETGITEIAVAGGVSANSELRKQLTATGEELDWNTYIPRLEYCTDNAAMIACAAQFKYQKGEFVGQDIVPLSRYAI